MVTRRQRDVLTFIQEHEREYGTAPVLEDIRKVYAVRSPYHKEWSKYVWLKLSENGYEDVTEAEIDEIATGKSQ